MKNPEDTIPREIFPGKLDDVALCPFNNPTLMSLDVRKGSVSGFSIAQRSMALAG